MDQLSLVLRPPSQFVDGHRFPMGDYLNDGDNDDKNH